MPEAATYRPHGIDDYGRVETEILTPMEEAYEFIREIGTGISHHFGALRLRRKKAGTWCRPTISRRQNPA